ncbi:hypothetical protein EZV62_005168 [Acer yangbiense]|uniref:Uncharacterized protein n=1 Tax=Acer yangbiense TaxID=1000413 RepID=A0A5C7ILQ3_9ROSI|nr:hypothetical protein EZV62_005168 [Acer yangbiense]
MFGVGDFDGKEFVACLKQKSYEEIRGHVDEAMNELEKFCGDSNTALLIKFLSSMKLPPPPNTYSTREDYVFKAIDALPASAHPMTQFFTGVMALQVA